MRQQLARVLSSTNRHDEAQEHLLQAATCLESQPLTPESRLNELDEQLADSYEDSGDQPNANPDYS